VEGFSLLPKAACRPPTLDEPISPGFHTVPLVPALLSPCRSLNIRRTNHRIAVFHELVLRERAKQFNTRSPVWR